MVTCTGCGATPELSPGFSRVISMSGSIMGDECIESLYFCSSCQCFTIEVYFDYFSGEESVSVQGPLSKKEGDRLVAVISRCSRPYDKKCRCEAHLEYFHSTLD